MVYPLYLECIRVSMREDTDRSKIDFCSDEVHIKEDGINSTKS
jgi:hypothetical protein